MTDTKKKRFAVLGVAGYIAPRHLKAIQDVGGRVVMASDPCDSVGLLDSFGYDICYHKSETEFWKNIDGEGIDYVTICTPNYLHSELVLRGLEAGCDVICEKPLVLSVDELDIIQTAEATTGHNAYAVLQLRLHHAAKELKVKYGTGHHVAELRYTTARGNWYAGSWKGDIKKSGGLLMNIGIHLFDLLLWVFGDAEACTISGRSDRSVSGILCLERAEVKWFLSIDPTFGVNPVRMLRTEDGRFDFSGGFNSLHTEVYEKIIAGDGSGSEDARASVALVEKLSNDSRICLR